jgi:MIP family channel proteins
MAMQLALVILALAVHLGVSETSDKLDVASVSSEEDDQCSLLQLTEGVNKVRSSPKTSSVQTGKLPTEALQGKLPADLLQGRLPTEMLQGKLPTEMFQGKLPTEMLQGKLPTDMLQGKLPIEMLQGKLPTEMLQGKLPIDALQGKLPAAALQGVLPREIASEDEAANKAHADLYSKISQLDEKLNAEIARWHGNSTEDGTPLQQLIEESSTNAEEIVANVDAKPLSPKAACAEFLAMTLFVIIGCGTAMVGGAGPGEHAQNLQVSLAFGLAITVLAYTIGHFSGGQINCAVTFGLCIHGSCTWAQGALNFVGQMLGSVFGALILHLVISEEDDKTGGLGSNALSKDEEGKFKIGDFLGELAMTFLLVFVVLETAVNPVNKANAMVAPIAIGFAVFLAHCLLIPKTGCSINPTRSFGPMVVRWLCYKNQATYLNDQVIFWVGPLIGAAGASLLASAAF